MGLALYPAFKNISNLVLPKNAATKEPLGLSSLAFGTTEVTILNRSCFRSWSAKAVTYLLGWTLSRLKECQG